jgi:hypothetical protein
MAVYLVGYDKKSGEDYQPLYDALENYDHWHELDSTWLITSEKSASEIRDDLTQFVPGEDKLLVITVSLPWASLHLNDSSWLKSRFRPQ